MFRRTFLLYASGMVANLSCLLGFFDMQLPSAHAESLSAILRLPGPSAFYEAFLDQPPPSWRSPGLIVGATIVGLRFDEPTGRFNPAILRVRLGETTPRSEGTLCLRVISRDGRYFARSQYNVVSGTTPTPLVEYPTLRAKILADYSDRDVAVSAFKSANCNDQNSIEFLAAQLTPSVSAKQLFVQIRAGEARVRAQLTRDNAPVTQLVLCNLLADGPTVGFSSECSIKLPDGLKSGNYELWLGETTSSGEIEFKSYSVFLWVGV
jgi:hypothetical protein